MDLFSFSLKFSSLRYSTFKTFGMKKDFENLSRFFNQNTPLFRSVECGKFLFFCFVKKKQKKAKKKKTFLFFCRKT
jgi:hypothetical protein